MKHRDAFDRCHPAINFLYFALVLVFTMVFLHPVSLGISLGTALAYAVRLKGGQAMKGGMKILVPMMLLAAILNPAFNHEGVTILTYLPSGNPLTLESILRGLAAAVMLAAGITWFQCYSAVLTSDKFVYLPPGHLRGRSGPRTAPVQGNAHRGGGCPERCRPQHVPGHAHPHAGVGGGGERRPLPGDRPGGAGLAGGVCPDPSPGGTASGTPIHLPGGTCPCLTKL